MSIEGREPAESRATAQILRATRRLGPNDHQAWTVRETDRGSYVRTTQDSVDALRWSDEVESRSFATWQQAVVDEPALTDLSASTPIRFEIEGLANQVALAGLLRCKSTEEADDVGWPYGEAGTVGDQKVYFLKRPDTDEYVPVLGDEDEILGDAIAEYSWSDDYFPVCTEYTSTLIEFSPGLAVLRPTGDLLEEELPSSSLPTTQKRVLAGLSNGLNTW